MCSNNNNSHKNTNTNTTILSISNTTMTVKVKHNHPRHPRCGKRYYCNRPNCERCTCWDVPFLHPPVPPFFITWRNVTDCKKYIYDSPLPRHSKIRNLNSNTDYVSCCQPCGNCASWIWREIRREDKDRTRPRNGDRPWQIGCTCCNNNVKNDTRKEDYDFNGRQQPKKHKNKYPKHHNLYGNALPERIIIGVPPYKYWIWE
mmetsp:Transcript_618/g.1193  ORF Transcript_618/g.1193 Transcript_618/m.1193 type:complete len:202 (+) Transcript_618:350-955(+)